MKSLQRGAGLILSGQVQLSVSIAPVDMEKSVLSFSVYPGLPSDVSADHLGAAFVSGWLSSGDSIMFERIAVSRMTHVHWQVVEYV